MIETLRTDQASVKVQLPVLVNFLVCDFFQTYFAKDKQVLVSEFFDSDTFYELARKHAKGRADYEDLMASAINEARKLKSSKRGTANHRRQPVTKKSEVTSDEAV